MRLAFLSRLEGGTTEHAGSVPGCNPGPSERHGLHGNAEARFLSIPRE